MSEYTELVFEGHLCEHCGGFIDTKGIDGFPQVCPGCARELRKAGAALRKVGNGNYQDITPIGRSKP